MSTLPDAASCEKDLGSILVIEMGAEGERARGGLKIKLQQRSKVCAEAEGTERTRERRTSGVAQA